MRVKSVLNRVQKFKSFVYGDIRWEDIDGNPVLVVEVWARKNSRPICSGCNRPGPGYDTLEARLFEFVPLYQIDAHAKRLLWVGKDRTLATLYRFFREFGEERTKQLQFICSDMWKAYLHVIAKKASQALHVLDRFHIAQHMNKAIDQVRAQEARDLKAKGLQPILKHSLA